MRKILVICGDDIDKIEYKKDYEIIICNDYVKAQEIIIKEVISFGVFEELNGFEDFYRDTFAFIRTSIPFVVYTKDYTVDNMRKLFKNGALDVIQGGIDKSNLKNIFLKIEEKSDKLFAHEKIIEEKDSLEIQLSEYKVLYETTRVLRLNLKLDKVINKLMSLIEGILGGIGVLLTDNQRFYSQDYVDTGDDLINKILRENGYKTLIEIIERNSAYSSYVIGDYNWYIFPIVIKSDLRGYLFLLRDTGTVMKEQETEVVNSILSQVGIVIENAKLIQRSKEIGFEIVKSLVKAIEAKDDYTKGHSQRVAEISRKIASRLNVNRNTMYQLEVAAVLHDVGKIGLPEKILNKKGNLTDWEYKQMKKHPINGYNIVSQINDMKYIARIIKHHHERWDGEGYPDGLEKDKVPFESRIIAVADTYDALTTDRPYRGGISHEDAVEEILRNKGTQFDPEIIEIFLTIDKESLE